MRLEEVRISKKADVRNREKGYLSPFMFLNAYSISQQTGARP